MKVYPTTLAPWEISTLSCSKHNKVATVVASCKCRFIDPTLTGRTGATDVDGVTVRRNIGLRRIREAEEELP